MRLVDSACSLCGSTLWTLHLEATARSDSRLGDAYRCTHQGYGSHFRIVRCRACGFLYCTPRPRPEDLALLYGQAEDPEYLEEWEARLVTARRRLRAIARHRPGARSLLDVGAHTGAFVRAALDASYAATGIEPSAWAVARAVERGLDVRRGALGEDDLGGRSFDVVTMWDVIEHLPSPLDGLASVRSLLSPGGLVAVHTMDAGAFVSRVAGRRWPWLMEMHLHYFTRATLARMLERAGFRVVTIAPEARDVSLRYLSTRLDAAIGGPAGRALLWVARSLGKEDAIVPFSLGDLVTAYAVKA